MSESRLMRIKDQDTRTVLYQIQLENQIQIGELKREIEELKRKQQPTQAIGYYVSPSVMSMETAFVKIDPG